MDGLIALLIIISVVSSIGKSVKKRKEAEARKNAAAPSVEQPKKAPTKIPYTREEWAQFLQVEGIPAAVAKPKEAAKPSETPAAEKPVAPKKRAKKAAQQTVNAPAPKPAVPETHPAVEGETEAEHAAHRQRIEREEIRVHAEHAAAQAITEVNLQALRNAVVMKEILDKPVSLRPRRRYS